MSIPRFVALYSQGLAWAGTVVLLGVLIADPRWLGQVPEMVVLFAAAIALRGMAIPLSKYSYLTQTALVGLAGSLLVGVPATALAIAGAILAADSGWARKPLRVPALSAPFPVRVRPPPPCAGSLSSASLVPSGVGKFSDLLLIQKLLL